METKSIVPAHPGFSVIVYDGDESDFPTSEYPIVAWGVTFDSEKFQSTTWPITPDNAENLLNVWGIKYPDGRVFCSDVEYRTVVDFTEHYRAVEKRAEKRASEPEKPVGRPKKVQPKPDDSDPVPISEEKPEVVVPEDLLGAVMALVNGDKEKKVRLVEMLGKYDAKTIGALAPEYRAEFWLQAQDL